MDTDISTGKDTPEFSKQRHSANSVALIALVGLVSVSFAAGYFRDELAWVTIACAVSATAFAAWLWRRGIKSEVRARTAEKLARDAERLLETEKRASTRLRDAADSISDGFALWDANDRLVLHNRRSPSNIRSETPVGTHFNDYIEAIYPLIENTTASGTKEAWLAERKKIFAAANGSHEVKTKSGRWFLITERRTAESGTVTIYTDITKLKLAEQEHELSENRLAQAQKLARIGIFEWDVDRRDMYWSEIMYEIVGLPTDTPALEMDQFILLVHPASRDLVRSTLNRLLRNGGQYNQEYEIIRPDGETRSVRAEARAIADHSGRIVKILGSLQDQTDAKRIEHALRRAKETAVEANMAKSEFLANVSHELRTPLNAVIGFSEVMLQEIFGPLGNPRYREYANDIRDSGSHLLGVINDILDFSKLEAGRLDLKYERVDIADVLQKSIRMMHQRAAAANVTLVNNTPEFHQIIEIDERKVTQILLNLISNAIKYTPEKGIVSLTSNPADKGVEISVSDTGIGMSAAGIKLALAPFGQVDSVLNRDQTGTGLGLPLWKSLAELHSGSLRIESSPGSGTNVLVYLPLKQSGTAEPPLQLVIGGQDG
ncbi:MAG: PAS domain-containing sensor histidine kinase [Alphaproteobacteria bacterium]